MRGRVSAQQPACAVAAENAAAAAVCATAWLLARRSSAAQRRAAGSTQQQRARASDTHVASAGASNGTRKLVWRSVGGAASATSSDPTPASTRFLAAWCVGMCRQVCRAHQRRARGWQTCARAGHQRAVRVLSGRATAASRSTRTSAHTPVALMTSTREAESLAKNKERRGRQCEQGCASARRRTRMEKAHFRCVSTPHTRSWRSYTAASSAVSSAIGDVQARWEARLVWQLVPPATCHA